MSLLETLSRSRCCWQHVVVVVADMKLLLACLVLLGCTVSHVSTSEQTQPMKRLLRGLENDREDDVKHESEYSKFKRLLGTNVYAVVYLSHVLKWICQIFSAMAALVLRNSARPCEMAIL